MSNINFLAISGSLRTQSVNSALLRASARLAPTGISIGMLQGLADLPLFNPDIEYTNPIAVEKLKSEILAADALIIASPEYAHGITGVLKNALDWLVSSEVFINKPIALFNAAPRAVHAYASLREIVTMMSAHVVDASCITLPMSEGTFDEDRIYNDANMSVAIHAALQSLALTVAKSRQP
ncbi:MAG: NAD(P)H-dependent oxidoreductase [Gallionella sp.]|nr:NAD(P)H-dependent oxidoreductase [Gallionella sp.]MDD4958883.1 NAD(P)H-dependent oxidoreductase [Gallionella sp.]